MLYPEIPPLESIPRTSLVGSEIAYPVPESVAIMAIIDPEHCSGELVRYGIYTDDGRSKPNEEDKLFGNTTFTGYTEWRGEKYYTSILVTFPNMFGRGLARSRRREPQATVYIEHPYLLCDVKGLNLEDANYPNYPMDDSEEPEF